MTIYSQTRTPLKRSGVLDTAHAFEDTTPVIGREYPNVNIVKDLLNASDSDELLRDLAITISERGVVFFRAQDNLSNDMTRILVQKLGEVTGKPSSSTIHIDPILDTSSGWGGGDQGISIVSSINNKRVPQQGVIKTTSRRYAASLWHSDIQYENFPAEYTALKATQLPSTGGDTLWASGYDIYDRFSAAYQRFLDGLTANFTGERLIEAVKGGRAVLYDGPRGNPENVGGSFTATHPVIRTNPVTGWKSVFALGNYPKRINELTPEESDDLLKKLYELILENHDLTTRFKWRNENDIAIWDNRSVFHTATFDYEGLGKRVGVRVTGVGERPYLDPNSKSKAQALAEAGKIIA